MPDSTQTPLDPVFPHLFGAVTKTPIPLNTVYCPCSHHPNSCQALIIFNFKNHFPTIINSHPASSPHKLYSSLLCFNATLPSPRNNRDNSPNVPSKSFQATPTMSNQSYYGGGPPPQGGPQYGQP